MSTFISQLLVTQIFSWCCVCRQHYCWAILYASFLKARKLPCDKQSSSTLTLLCGWENTFLPRHHPSLPPFHHHNLLCLYGFVVITVEPPIEAKNIVILTAIQQRTSELRRWFEILVERVCVYCPNPERKWIIIVNLVQDGAILYDIAKHMW